MSRCYLCDTILSDEDQRIVYRLECELAKKGKVVDKYDEICSFCRYGEDGGGGVDTLDDLGYNVLAEFESGET